MSESVAAAQKKDFERFHDLAWRAVQLGPPVHTQLLYLLARAQAQSGRPADAAVTLERLGRMGIPTNARTQDDFRAARAVARWPAVDAILQKAAAPSGTSEIAYRIPERDLIPEALTYDSARRRFLVGSLYHRKIVQVDERTGATTDFMTADAGKFDGVLGLKIDRTRGLLLVASAALPEMRGFTQADQGRSMLHVLSLATGRAVAAIAPPGAGPHLLNDLVITRRGEAIVTDSAAGVVHRLRAGGRALETIAAIGANTYPNGIALDEDRDAVYVGSFAGLSRVDLKTRRVSVVRPAGDIALGGIDGLAFHRGSLIAVQNSLPGVTRVVRLVLDDAGGRVLRLDLFDSNLPDHNWPTTGAIVGDDFYYIANSQLRSFESPGKVWPSEKLQPPILRRIPLGRR